MDTKDQTSSGDRSERIFATAVSLNKSSGRKIIFRFIKDFEPSFDRSEYAKRVTIVWRYEAESGLPDTQERHRMDDMEDRIASHVSCDAGAILALVSTGENLREWIFYARSEGEYADRFDRAFAAWPELPIEIHSCDDPAWMAYETFRRDLKT